MADLTATSNSSTFIYLEWKEVTEGSANKSFLVCREWDSEEICKNVTETFVEVTNLTSNTRFTFTVSGINDGGKGKESTKSSLTCKMIDLLLKVKLMNF